jgi:uncharacterized membrane protein (DUF2068 family)
LIANTLISFRAVAIFEALKGVFVLVAAGILVDFLHADAQGAAEELVRHFHMNPARHYPRIFIETASHLGNAHLLALSLGALVYAAVRFAEAYGLWLGRSWAWGFGLISAGLYLPFELAELAQRVSWAGLVVLIVNFVILVVLWQGRAR